MLRRLALILSICLAVPAMAQIPGIPAPKVTTTAPKEETPEQIRKRLADWQKDARTMLARLEDPAAETQLPKGIPPSSLVDRRRDLDQMVRTISRIQGLLDQIPEAKSALKEAESARDSWNGFPEAPPYSILKFDDLVNQREAAKEKDSTFKSSSSTFLRSLDGLETETKASEEQMRQTVAQAEKNPADDAVKWRLDTAREKNRYLSVRAMFVRSNIDLLKEQAAASAARLALLDRQVTNIRKNIDFSDEDLESIRKSSNERRASIRKEISDLNVRIRDASTARIRAKTTFDQLNTESAQANPTPELGVATAKLSAAEVRLDVLQFISENLESFDSLEGFVPVAYENRRILQQSKDRKKQDTAYEALSTFVARLRAWETVCGNEISALNADLSAQDSNASAMPPDDPRQPALADQRKALWEKQAFLQRVSQTVTAHRKNIARWLEGFEGERKSAGVLANLSDSGNSLWSMVKGFWSFEVMKFQNVRDVAGVPITETQSVSLGVIISALTFFVVAYLISAKFSRRVQRVVVGRGHIAEAQANTLRNWLMIVVGVVLALTTLHFLRIPLTVFAFFGGALAIGLGFGTQTLIKNFISGIIVLFERKIRVGDILELDANTSGTVVEINTRSSVLRNAEGKETLIPNSLFLENRVTNLTLSNRRVRRVIRLGVGHSTDPSQVIPILKECADRHGLILKDPSPVVTLDDITPGGLTFAVYFWTEFNIKTDSNIVSSDMRIMIDKRFSEAGIQFQNSDMNLRTEIPLQVDMVQPEFGPTPPPKRNIP